MIAAIMRIGFALGVTAPAAVIGGNVVARVADATGAPVADAVVSLTPLEAAQGPVTVPEGRVEVMQIGEEYRPYVTPVVVGTEVHFPNRDAVQHHLYSLSKAKPFEKPLYDSGSSESVVFDRPGVVTLGCNIHDWMVAYVVVLETAHFAKTGADGSATLTGLPAGRYRLDTWHPRVTTPAVREISVPASGESAEAVALKLRPDRRIRRAPAGEGKAY